MKRFTLVAFACAMAGLVAPGLARAKSSCWEQVISDWSAHNSVKGRYAAGCYRQALSKLPEDLRTYSSASDDIRRALQTRLTKAPATAATPIRTTAGDGGSSRLLLLGIVFVAVVALAFAVIR